jgi:hypothetical protein
MVTTTEPLAPRINDDQLRELLALSRGADSIELKLTVPASGQRSALNTLGLDPLDTHIRQIFFFDTPALTLNDAGIVLRARRIQDKGEDSVVKLRPVVPETLPEEWRQSPAMVVEVDAMPGGFVCSATMKGRPTPGTTRAVQLGQAPIRKLFNKEQKAFLDAHTAEPVDVDSLTLLGPIFVLKQSFVPADFKRKLVAELWFYPDGSRILELSTKCAPAEMMQVVTETRLYMGDLGITLNAAQETKTKSALQFFAKEAARDTAKKS